jgi:hypothetical protein
MAERVVSFAGLEVVAGLTWSLRGAKADKIQGGSTITRLRRHISTPHLSYQLVWADRITSSADARVAGCGALSQAIARILPQDLANQTVLVAVSDEDQQLHTAFLLAASKPVLWPEALFESAEGLVVHLVQTLAEGEADALFASPALLRALSPRIPSVEIPDAGVAGAGLPVFTKVRNWLRPAATMTAVLGGAFVLVSYVAPVVGNMLFPAPVTVAKPKATPMLPDAERLQKSCLAAFEANWPSVPGWTMTAYGCDPDDGPGRAKAWKELTLDPGHDNIVATHVAQMMFKNWPHPVEYSTYTINTHVPLDIAWVKEPPILPGKPVTSNSLLHDARGMSGSPIHGGLAI